MNQTKHYFELPRSPRAEVILNARHAYLSVILPEETINLLPDPEMFAFGNGVASYQGSAAFINLTADATRQRRGLYSVHVTNLINPGSGIETQPATAMQANQPYTFSADHYGVGDYLIRITNRLTGVPIATRRFTGADFWQRVSVTAVVGTPTLVDLQVVAENGPVSTEYRYGFWTDGWQWERKAYPTTFVSGNLPGFPGESPNPYGWTGTPHNSASFRRSTTRSGGREFSFDELGYQIYEIEGLGMGEVEHSIQSYALDHGGVHGCSRLTEREFSISGVVCAADGIVDLHCTRQNLIKALSPLFGGGQPVRLHYQLYECDDPVSSCFSIDALYAGGLEFNLTNHHTERISIDFTAPDPFVYECGTVGDELVVPTGALDIDGPGLPARGEDGAWRLTTPQSILNVIIDLEAAADGYMYALVAQGANTLLQRWDGQQWETVLSRLGAGRALAATPDGGLYVVGQFGPGPAFDYVLRYDTLTGAVNNLQGTVVTNNLAVDFPGLHSAVYDPRGKLIVGGGFTSISNVNGTVTTENVAAYDIATQTWEIMGSAARHGLPDLIGSVLSLAVSPVGNIVAGGHFQANYMAGYFMGHLAYFDIQRPDQWRYIDDVHFNNNYAQARVRVVRFGPNGYLYVGGYFNDTFGNNYTGRFDYGDTTIATSRHHPITNIGYFTELAGDLGRLAGNNGPIIPRMRSIQNGLPECYCLGGETIDNCAVVGVAACQAPGVYDIAEVYDMSIGCDGEVWIGGQFNEVWGPRLGSPTSPDNVIVRIPAVAVARFTPDHVWRPTDIQFAPNGYSVPGTPRFVIQALEHGTRCTPVGFNGPDGLGDPGPDITGDDVSVPTDFADSIFLGIVIHDDLLPYTLFARRTTIDTRCSEDAKPILRIQGPGILKSIKNATTGVSIEFNDYHLLADELLTIDLSARIPRMYSNYASQNAYSAITNLSQLGRFNLVRGENDIDILIDNVDDDGNILTGTRAWIEWRPRYLSVDVACAAECQR